MTIEEILNGEKTPKEIISALQQKSLLIPVWNGRRGLIQEFDPTKHPVMDKAKYPDIISDEGVEYVTRITLDLQRLATKRMTELVTGIPVKRVYKAKTDKQKEIARVMEAIYDRNRINSVNNERCNMLFAGCEVLTLWYAVEQENNDYGIKSKIKMRCRNFSPMLGDDLYPLFNKYGDMIAMSVGYTRKVKNRNVNYFDAYTAAKHLKYSDESGEWLEITNEPISLGKIPAVYVHRPTPIWEDTSKTVYEIEWALSRNGNYLRKNSKPIFVVLADDIIQYGNEKGENKEFKTVMQYPKGSTAQYVTWEQAVENLKFFVDNLRNLFFTQLQLPDWSYDKMSQQALSGESRKQLFIDAQLKVTDESGRLLEAFDREINVVKSFVKVIMGQSYESEIDALQVENIITPFTITDEKDTIENLMTANGNQPIISQREAIELYGHSDDVDRTLNEIADQNKVNVFEPTV